MKKVFQVVSCILVLTMALQIAPIAVFAQVEAPASTETRENIYGSGINFENLTDDLIVGEDTELREENIKYFRLTDGTKVAAVYDHPVHEQDAAGKWQEIDNTLADGEDSWENAKISFSKNPKNGKLYTLKTDDYKIEWGFASSVYETAAASKSERKADAKRLKTAVKSGSEIVRYTNMLPGVDLEYQMLGHDVKENIIVKSAQALKPLVFTLKVNNLTVTKEENVIVFRNEENEIVSVLSAPYMVDAEGKMSGDVELILTGSGNHYQVEVRPDADWMADAAYPVTIDPLLEYQAGNYGGNTPIQNTSVISIRPDSNEAYEFGSVFVGKSASYQICYGVYKFSLPESIKGSDRVIGAQLVLKKYQFSGSSAVTVNVHQITSSVSINTLTWNGLAGKYDSTVLDSQILTNTITDSNGNTGNIYNVSFDITTAVRDWYQNGNNYGLVLRPDTTESKWVSFYTDNYGGMSADYYPTLFLQYASYTGVESSLTYHSAGSDRMGTISVCDFTGNLTYTLTDAATTGNYLPISLSHYYDNSLNYPSYYLNNGYYGKGFRITFPRIIPTERLNNGVEASYPYCYLDEDGTHHYFQQVDGEYQLEYNSRIKLEIDNTSNQERYALVLSDTSTMYFDSNGMPYRLYDSATGKSATFTIANGVLTKLTDGAGHTITLTYTDRTEGGATHKFLNTVTDPSGKVTTYTYDSNNRLASITRPGNRVISYAYNSNGLLSQITDSDGSRIVIAYGGGKNRVSSITEYGENGTAGAKLTFAYESGQTTVTDRDGKSETMLFNSMGHTVSVRDHVGNAVFGKYDTESESNDKKNTLLYASEMQSTVKNLLSNGDLEDASLGAWTTYSSGSLSGSRGRNTSEKYGGSASLKVASSAPPSGRYGYRQQISATILAGKTYTVSAWVKVTSMAGYGSPYAGVMMDFSYANSAGTWYLNRGERIAQATDGWTRISHTFTVPSNYNTSSGLYVILGVEDAIGTVYFDQVQVEEDPVANDYNLIDNGHFRDAVGTAVPASWVGQNLQSGDKVTANGFVITGNRNTYKNISQTVAISGEAGDAFTFGAWVQAEALSKDYYFNSDKKRDCAVRITFLNGSTEVNKGYFDFQAGNANKQFLSGQAIASGEYTAVQIALLYNNQKNSATFSDIQLFQEGSQTRYEYDNFGRLKTETNVYEERVSYTYDGESDRVLTVTYPDNRVERYTYDETTKLLKTHKTAYGVVTNYHYDANGNLIHSIGNKEGVNTSTLVSGSTTYTGAYATGGVDAFGNTTTLSINQTSGLLNSATDVNGNTTNYTYDANTDALTNVVFQNSRVGYSYVNDRLKRVFRNTTSASSTYDVLYLFGYDEFGNTDTISVGKTTGTTMELVDHDYAANNGHLLQTTYGNGDYINPVYDNLDRVVGMKYNGVQKYSWSYGANGQMGLLTDSVNNVEYRYEYDSGKRLTRIVGKPGSTSSLPKTDFASDYNEKGQLVGITHKVASSVLKSSYVYDGYSRLQNEKSDLNGTTIAYKGWAHDDLGRVAYTDFRVAFMGAPIVKTTYTYSSGVMPTGVSGKSGPTTSRVSGITLQSQHAGWSEAYTYTYDKAGNITGIAKDGTTIASYAYDAMNQLTAATQNGITYNVSYDKGGNILSKTASAGNSHTYTYSHAVWKDLLTAVDNNLITYDEIGNPLTYYDGTAFTWEGRQMQSATIGSTAISYTYNSDGYRTSKTVDGVKTIYVLDGSKVIMEQTGTGTPIYYTYDAAGLPTTMTVGSTTYYYIYNLQGDIIAITNNNGIKVVEYTYDPWGKIISTTGSMASSIGVQNPYRYRAYRYDTELEMYYLNSRYYDPEIGRFINADDVGLLGVNNDITSYNLYAYCGNNPINRADNGGQFWHIVAGAAIGAVIGAVSSIAAQAISGQEINWAEVGVSAASGAVTGAITAACPAMGAVATGVVHGVVGAGTYVATELVNGRTPTIEGTVVAGVVSGVLAGVTRAIGNKIAKPKIPENSGAPFKGVGTSQVGVDPNTLKLNPNFTPNPAKYAAALNQIQTNGMYGVIDVARNGLVYNGQHRVLIARQLGIAVDVIIR